MGSYYISGIKIVIQLILFIAFLIHFAVPSLKKYGKKETISVTSEAETNGMEAPDVTISVFLGAQCNRWKSAQGQFTWDTFDLVLSIVKTSRCQIWNCAWGMTLLNSTILYARCILVSLKRVHLFQGYLMDHLHFQQCHRLLKKTWVLLLLEGISPFRLSLKSAYTEKEIEEDKE